MHHFSWDSLFWVFNWVANFAYSRYSDMIVDIQQVQRELEGGFLADQAGIDKAALALHAQAPELARDYLTKYSVAQGELVHKRWRKLGEDLLVKYMDGNVKDTQGNVTHPKYPGVVPANRPGPRRCDQGASDPHPDSRPHALKPLPPPLWFHSRSSSFPSVPPPPPPPPAIPAGSFDAHEAGAPRRERPW